MSLICFACKQDHMKPLKHWCDVSSLEIQYDNSLKANRWLSVEKQALQKENRELKELVHDLYYHHEYAGNKPRVEKLLTTEGEK